jgi:hypothetical protein
MNKDLIIRKYYYKKHYGSARYKRKLKGMRNRLHFEETKGEPGFGFYIKIKEVVEI